METNKPLIAVTAVASTAIVVMAWQMRSMGMEHDRRFEEYKKSFAPRADGQKTYGLVATSKEVLEIREELKGLRGLVNSRTLAATTGTIHTREVIREKPNEILISDSDTVRIRDTVYIKEYPRYSLSKKTEWLDLKAWARRDSFLVDVGVTNKFEFTITKSKSSWLRPSDSVSFLFKNLNPHTTAPEVYSYAYKPKKPKRLLWFGVGVGLGFVGGLIAK
jgi:hypothetical protein